MQQFPSSQIELFILADFLSPQECAELIQVMDGAWKPSTIADDIGMENYRTSETCNIDSTIPVVAALEDRITALTGLNPLHGEPLQAQRYGVGQEFKEHTDYFEPDGPDFQRFCSKTGQRTWTVMIYLNEPEAGGVTYFKNLNMGVKPTGGTLLAWNNLTIAGQPNPFTLHHGMPVEQGTKYILTKWFREKPWPWPDEVAERLANRRRFDGSPSAAVSAATDSSGGTACDSAPLFGKADGTALKQRNWILSVKEVLAGLVDERREVPRVRALRPGDFLRDYYAPGRPVIIQGEMQDWPALRLWTPEYLKHKVGAAPVEFQGQRNANAQFELQKDVHKRKLPFDTYIDLITKQPGNDAYITANNSNVNQAALECLFEDVQPLSKFMRGSPGMPWIGPIGTFTPLHFDLTNNLIAQVVGSKRCVLLPPSETQRLYNHRHVFSAVHDVMDEEALQKFPLARDAITYELQLDAGELLFIPIGWWHQVTALDFSVSFTLIDFLWKNDFYDSFPGD